MSITTYSELKTAVQNWAARSDSSFTNRIDEFIDLCEARVHYGSGEPGQPYYSEPLRIRGMMTASDITISSQSVAQPTGFLELIRIYLNTDPKNDLDYMAPDRFWASSVGATASTGKPVAYTIEGTNFVFGPAPDSSYTGKVLHFKKMDALSDSATTNWLITNAPNVYLYGSMLEYSIWEGDDEGAGKYAALYSTAINGLVTQDKRSSHGTPLRMMADRVA